MQYLTTHTIGIPGDRPFLSFLHCLHQTGRHTTRLITVHALFLYKDLSLFRFVTVDNRPLAHRLFAVSFSNTDSSLISGTDR